MSPLSLLAITILFLTLPWLLGPGEGRGRGEIRGPMLVLWWINRLYCSIWHHLESSETTAVPASGAALLVSNHTCGIDHMLLQAMTRRALGFLIAQEFYDWWFARPFCRIIGCIPVKRDGRDLSATRAAIRALKEGRVVPIFPEGRITPTSGRVIGEAKPGVAFIALRTGFPVIPAYIRGTPETNDIFRSIRTPSEARVVFGPPVDLSDLDLRDDDREALDVATRRIMRAIRSLRDHSLGIEPGDEPEPSAAAEPPALTASA